MRAGIAGPVDEDILIGSFGAITDIGVNPYGFFGSGSVVSGIVDGWKTGIATADDCLGIGVRFEEEEEVGGETRGAEEVGTGSGSGALGSDGGIKNDCVGGGTRGAGGLAL